MQRSRHSSRRAAALATLPVLALLGSALPGPSAAAAPGATNPLTGPDTIASVLDDALAERNSVSASAQQLRVLRATKITEGSGGFTGDLDVQDGFGTSVARLGDLNGDGVEDLAVGTWWDDDGGGFDRGAVYVLFLNADGTVGSEQKISDTEGGFEGTLGNATNFGTSVSAIGDLDGDGVTDLAVGAQGTGSVWILFLNPDGTVRAEQEIAEGLGGFTGDLGNANDAFGEGVASLGDLDGDGVLDIAVGAPLDDDGGVAEDPFENFGAVWILFLNANGTVHDHQKISQTEGGFTGDLDNYDDMGKDVAAVGDVNGDGVTDLAAGAWSDNEGRVLGAVWIIFLKANGTVFDQQKISETQGGFTGELADFARFGISVAATGDLDGDGVPDLAVGAPNEDDERGSVWLLYLNADGTVRANAELSSSTPGFEGELVPDDLFGDAVAALGDLDGDGVLEIAVGASLGQDPGGGVFGTGAVWVLSVGTDRVCNGTIRARTVEGNVVVPEGGTCVLKGTTVAGNVFIANEASLRTKGARIEGNIQTSGDNYRQVVVAKRTVVRGDLRFDGGDRFKVKTARVGGSIQVEDNNGPSKLAQNRVEGDTRANDNDGGLAIRRNLVGGDLQCKGNEPPPTGGRNRVEGDKVGQCSSL